MTDPKDPIYKARRKVKERLERTGLRVVLLHDEVFDLEASDEDSLKKIKVCLDRVPDGIIEVIAQIPLPPSCRRQIWLKRFNAANFEIIKIKPRQ